MTDKANLAMLRVPFEDRLISKLPKPTKQETEEVKQNYKVGIRCTICGAWHHPKVVHLDYVGHAALTDRLLDADPEWSWEPLAIGPDGLPVIDADGGMWIRLTVCGVTRLGYGDAQGKTGGNAMKERIGDALRNAAMRFGAALDLWHKGDLHGEEPPEVKPEVKPEPAQKVPPKLINPLTKTADYDLSDARAFELHQAAQLCVSKFEAGDQTAAWEEISGITDNGEKLYLWAVLKEYSAVRSMLKKAALVK